MRIISTTTTLEATAEELRQSNTLAGALNNILRNMLLPETGTNETEEDEDD